MADLETNAKLRVLHVGAPPELAGGPIADALSRANCEVVDCPDVYRALARVCGCWRDGFVAIVVCLDRLAASQFEFLEIVSHRRGSAPLYVYAGDAARSKIELAVRLGAKEEINAETIEHVLMAASPAASALQEAPEPENGQLAPAAEPACEVARGAAGDVPGEVPAELQAPIPLEPETAIPPPPETAQPSAPAAEVPSEAPPPPADTEVRKRTSSVRVPWLRYEGGPQRTPPKNTTGPVKMPEPSVSESEPPLLTPEEIKALMGEEGSADSAGRGGKRGRRK